MEKITENNCTEGCNWDIMNKEAFGTFCECLPYNLENTCPCESCIVKTMCDEECPDWRKWVVPDN